MSISTPISGLPDAILPLSPSAMFPMDVTSTGPTAKTMLANIIAAVINLSMTNFTTTGGIQKLPPSSGRVYIYNSVAPLQIAPPDILSDGLTYTIVDGTQPSGNAGRWPFTFVGTIGGVINPTLLDISGGSTELQYHNNNWYRLR